MIMSNTHAPQVFILPSSVLAAANELAAQGREEAFRKWQEETKDTDGVYRVGVNLDEKWEAKAPEVTRIRSGLYRAEVDTRTFHIEEIHNGQHWTWRVSDQDVFHDGWVGDFDTKREALANLPA
jgi:hypothetical protein